MERVCLLHSLEFRRMHGINVDVFVDCALQSGDLVNDTTKVCNPSMHSYPTPHATFGPTSCCHAACPRVCLQSRVSICAQITLIIIDIDCCILYLLAVLVHSVAVVCLFVFLLSFRIM